MFLPEISPSRSEVQRSVTEAIRSPAARIYIDSSVLIHCYEMSRSACDELLSAFELLSSKVRVPVWCAKETWEHTRGLTTKRPLQKTAGQLKKRLADFRTHSLRYVDEKTFADMSVERYTTELDEAIKRVSDLSQKVEKIEYAHDAASARLLPYITLRAINSDMSGIYAEVQETGEARFLHEVPPGYGDGGSRIATNTEDETEESVQQKGKKKNRFGDLIMWLEALADCKASEGEHLVVLTRDNTKKDWVYNPDRVKEDDKLQQNGGLVTLALPMLEQEARRRCVKVQSVHVISLELFIQIMRNSYGARVGNLARALQDSTRSTRSTATGPAGERRGLETDELGELGFGSADMMFEPPEQEEELEIWQALKALKSDGWTIQNEAATRLAAQLPGADDDQLKQAGRGLMNASNEDALAPVEVTLQILVGNVLPAHAKANVIIGLLAEAYFSEDGEPKKPQAHPEIVSALFELEQDDATRRAYEITIGERLAPHRRLYLALPGEERKEIRLEIMTRNGRLLGVQADDKQLLEADVPESRRLPSAEEPMALGDLLVALAREFVVPAGWFKVEGPTNIEFTIPERMGFIAWGPNTGEQLR